jgi:hypothetical protein
MLHDLQVLRLSQEHLVRILTRSKRVSIGTGVHLRHLLRHLVCSWQNGTNKLANQLRYESEGGWGAGWVDLPKVLTIIIAQDEDKHWLQAKQTQEVPR